MAYGVIVIVVGYTPTPKASYDNPSCVEIQSKPLDWKFRSPHTSNEGGETHWLLKRNPRFLGIMFAGYLPLLACERYRLNSSGVFSEENPNNFIFGGSNYAIYGIERNPNP
ncbi:hypothetical protein NE237_030087 [Protea cynaroides]|uniref:Uncharacterized protein n=1 Tax=Protea cynaroides TaxID=273540 RepID=A0A9Q0JWN2_9MAGN|nr:hypothetical protein NE237_030087 [Protea cynaroides]